MGVCCWVVGVLQHSLFVGWEGLFTLQGLLGLSKLGSPVLQEKRLWGPL